MSRFRTTRKVGVILGLATLALVSCTKTTDPKAKTPSRPSAFSFAKLQAIAQAESLHPYVPTVKPLPPALDQLKLEYEQLHQINWKEEKNVWRDENLPFQLAFFFKGNKADSPVEINLVDENGVTPYPYEPNKFDFGQNHFPQPFPADLGYAGFRIHHEVTPGHFEELVVFQGASYFRSLVKQPPYGLSARGLALNTALPQPEEFPNFTQFWIQKPKMGDKSIHLWALLNSNSLSGAYEFEVTPGEAETTMPVHATLYVRKKMDRLALAPLTSMFWFGKNSRDHDGDFRPEVHDSDGLLMQTGKDEWVWRPLERPLGVQLTGFPDEHPQGFGLLQRDRHFYNYYDLIALYHERPSLWVEPQSDWGKGQVRLFEMATIDEYHDNVVAFWEPDQIFLPGESLDFRYNLHWYMENSAWPPLWRCTQTRVSYPNYHAPLFYVLEFSPPTSDRAREVTDATELAFTSSLPDVIYKLVKQQNPDGSWRVVFEIRPKDKTAIEIKGCLKNGDKVISETWTTIVHP